MSWLRIAEQILFSCMQLRCTLSDMVVLARRWAEIAGCKSFIHGLSALSAISAAVKL